MGMEDFQFLLGDLATAFREDALWSTVGPDGRIYQPVAIIAGRFRIDPFEVPLGGHEPGAGETQIWFYCDRAVVPQPWPVLGDQLTIRGQLYEIVQRDEDDIGEFGFRLIRQEIGISTVTSEGVYSPPEVDPLRRPVQPETLYQSSDLRPPPALPPLYAAALGIPAAPSAAVRAANGRPSRRGEIEAAFRKAVAAGKIDPSRPLKELCAVMHQQLGNGGGLSSRTLRRVVGGLVRGQREAH
jgi:hypothetical protein